MTPQNSNDFLLWKEIKEQINRLFIGLWTCGSDRNGNLHKLHFSQFVHWPSLVLGVCGVPGGEDKMLMLMCSVDLVGLSNLVASLATSQPCTSFSPFPLPHGLCGHLECLHLSPVSPSSFLPPSFLGKRIAKPSGNPESLGCLLPSSLPCLTYSPSTSNKSARQ